MLEISGFIQKLQSIQKRCAIDLISKLQEYANELVLMSICIVLEHILKTELEKHAVNK